MRAEGRTLPRAALELDEDGFSFFGAWMIGGETVARILAPVKGALSDLHVQLTWVLPSIAL